MPVDLFLALILVICVVLLIVGLRMLMIVTREVGIISVQAKDPNAKASSLGLRDSKK